MLRHTRRLQEINPRYPLFAYALVIFFWTLADATGQYVAPLLMEERGLSYTMIGLILGSSSIVGAAFDLLVSMIFKNTNFRRLMLVMFALCLVYPLILFSASTLWMFLFAMALWGIYFDLYNISTFAFISRFASSAENTAGFGALQAFRSLGLILAPLVVGFAVVASVGWYGFTLYYLYLGIAIIFFIVLLYLLRARKMAHETSHKRRNILLEIRLWRRVGKALFPLLFLMCFLYMLDAFFWTLGPLYGDAEGAGGYGGLLIVAYALPMLIVGWFVGSLARRFGKTHVAYSALFLGSLILSFFALIPPGPMVIALVFIAMFCINFSFPAISAMFADYIARHRTVEGETESMEDLSANVGYIVGPAAAGFLADMLGIPLAFSVIGAGGVLLALILLTAGRGRVL